MTPTPFTIARRSQELKDTFTVELMPTSADGFVFKPGQFNMLYAFGVGEVPISISGDPNNSQKLVHTVRTVGAVTDALSKLKKGAEIGVRGPFGSPWPVVEAEGNDVVIIAGGIGLGPVAPGHRTCARQPGEVRALRDFVRRAFAR